MEDIKLNNIYKKILYWCSLYVSLSVVIVVWLLSVYGKQTADNTTKKKNVLNKTWQKFVFVYGSIMIAVIILFMFIGLFL